MKMYTLFVSNRDAEHKNEKHTHTHHYKVNTFIGTLAQHNQ